MSIIKATQYTAAAQRKLADVVQISSQSMGLSPLKPAGKPPCSWWKLRTLVRAAALAGPVLPGVAESVGASRCLGS